MILDRSEPTVEAFLGLTEEKLGRKLSRVPKDAVLPRPVAARGAHIGVHAQKQPGLNWVGVALNVGRLSCEQMRGLAKVALSVTTLDRMLARTMEPRASTPTKRLGAIRALSEAGVPASVMVAPILPGLNDHEIERIIDSAANAGAREAGYVLLRLPLEVAPIFKDWLLRHYPDRYRHVMSLIRSMRDGKDYDSEWGKRMKGSGPYAWQIGRRFEIAARRLGLNLERRSLRTDLFKPPARKGEQLMLL